MAQLPQELIVEIVLYLPVKSLLRFRCLSKSLCAIIESPDFINSYMSMSSQKFDLRKLIFTNSSWKKFHVCDVNVDFKHEILPLQKPVSLLWKKLCGHCNGLFLLKRNYSFGFSLWNPSTQQFRDLPDCPVELPANAQFKRIIGLGLGYDDSINDYKVFLIVHVQRKLQDESEVQVWVYGLKSNIWRRALDFPYLGYTMETGSCCFRSPGIGYFTDASLHWLCYKTWKPKIVAFDVINETFSLVPQPNCKINSSKGVDTKLHVSEGCLFISYFMISRPLHAYLYMRKRDEANQFSWTKLFSVSKHILGRTAGKFWLGNMKVLGYSERENKILLNLNEGGMVWYDVKKKSFAKVQITKRVSKWHDPILCRESLVSVGVE